MRQNRHSGCLRKEGKEERKKEKKIRSKGKRVNKEEWALIPSSVPPGKG